MGNRIRELRLAREEIAPGAFTSLTLAQRVGVTQSALLQWERGETKPRNRHRKLLARAFRVEESELGLDEPAPEEAAHG